MKLYQTLLLTLLCLTRSLVAQSRPRVIGLCSLLRDLAKFDNTIVTVKGIVEVSPLDTRPTSFPIDKLVDKPCAASRKGSRNRSEIGIRVLSEQFLRQPPAGFNFDSDSFYKAAKTLERNQKNGQRVRAAVVLTGIVKSGLVGTPSARATEGNQKVFLIVAAIRSLVLLK